LFLSLLVAYALWRGWWLPLVPPALAASAAASIVTAHMSQQERVQRALLMQLFSRHVSPEIAETLWQRRAELFDEGRLRPQRAIVTVLFTDLQGFTAVSERLDEETLMGWLNTYLEATAQLVITHGGVIDNYVGDALKADFGVPLPRTTEAEIALDAVNAVTCALAIEEAILRLNTLWQERAFPAVGMRLGIFTGPVVAGSLGSAQRLKYTTVGDTVNTASRLESLAQDGAGLSVAPGQCRILIGEATLRYLGQQFITQRVGEVSLKGKEQRITVYRVLGRAQQPQITAPAPATLRAESATPNPGARSR
jgi:adenylate cyclase